jgi:hypothetical protein
MDKLTQLRVPPAWATALTACLDEPPPTRRPMRVWWAALVITLAGASSVATYLIYEGLHHAH